MKLCFFDKIAELLGFKVKNARVYNYHDPEWRNWIEKAFLISVAMILIGSISLHYIFGVADENISQFQLGTFLGAIPMFAPPGIRMVMNALIEKRRQALLNDTRSLLRLSESPSMLATDVTLTLFRNRPVVVRRLGRKKEIELVDESYYTFPSEYDRTIFAISRSYESSL